MHVNMNVNVNVNVRSCTVAQGISGMPDPQLFVESLRAEPGFWVIS